MAKNKSEPITGLIIDSEADAELDAMVEQLYIILTLKGMPPMLLDVTHDNYLRDIILAQLPEGGESNGN